jgi:cation transport ATPase
MKTNYLAVVVAAIAYWLLGAVWFAVLFTKPWMQLEHIPTEQVAAMKGAAAAFPYIMSFVLNLIIAFVLAQLCAWRNATTAARGASLGVLLWIGIVGPITYTTSMYEMRQLNLFLINEGYVLVGLFLMGAILGAWTKKSA